MEGLRDAWPDGLEGGDCCFRLAGWLWQASTAASSPGRQGG